MTDDKWRMPDRGGAHEVNGRRFVICHLFRQPPDHCASLRRAQLRSTDSRSRSGRARFYGGGGERPPFGGLFVPGWGGSTAHPLRYVVVWTVCVSPPSL